MTEVVHRVERGCEREERKDQDKSKCFNGPCAGPLRCQHSSTFALMVALALACGAPADGRHYAQGT